MSHEAKPQWGFAAKNARSATRVGLWVGVGEPVTVPQASWLRTPHPNPPHQGEGAQSSVT